MHKILTGQQMRDIDKKAIDDLKIPSLILMENSGRAVYEQIIKIIDKNQISSPSVLIVCGKGNNGGDGFVTARILIENNIQTTVISLAEESQLSKDALVNHNILKHFTEIFYFENIGDEKFIEILKESNLIIDAILGTGIKNEITGNAKKAIKFINEFAEETIISVDIASGIDSDTGKVLGNAIFADSTVTFFAPKVGNILYPGAEHCGNVVVSKISIPEFLIDNSKIKDEKYNLNLITSKYVSQLKPIRPGNSHKGTFGNVLTLAGSYSLLGAAYMSAFSALKSGAGYSTLATPKSMIPTFSSISPEIIYLPLEDNNEGIITDDNISNVLNNLEKFGSILIGPGIGTNNKTVNFVKEVIEALVCRSISCVLDADALNCLALLDNFILPENSVITPHPKELSRLLKKPLAEILDDRISSAIEAAETFNTIVILKGARTIIAEPDRTVYINPTGNTALATAGTGDVLAGMIAGFIAQSVSPVNASILSVYIHGLAGELAANDMSEYSTTATNIMDYIPRAIKILF